MRRLSLGLLIGVGVLGWSASVLEARELSFQERVQAQEAIERVRFSHQIGTTESFEDAVPRDVIEAKVVSYLEQSAALEKVWHTPVTAEMLGREMERIAARSRMSERLEELYAALGNDPFLVAECIARPTLVGRLSRSFLASDRVTGKNWTEVREELELEAVRPVADSIDRLPRANPASGSSAFAADTWDNGSLDDVPDGRWEHIAVWTGTEMIVWGGYANSGGAYDPATDTWRLISTKDAPVARRELSAVWTGTEMIVFGGRTRFGYECSDIGSRYDPVADRWTATSTVDAPPARCRHTAVWTGTEMIVWGGYGNTITEEALESGGKYDPATDRWTRTETYRAPSARSRHVAVWTGTRMIIWGGTSDNTGGQYNPVLDFWTPTSTFNTAGPRWSATAVWTGQRMLMWGGYNEDYEPEVGAQYDPVADVWTWMSYANAPAGRTGHTAVWTGIEMLVWGGGFGGGRYNPESDSWVPISTTGSFDGVGSNTTVWTGSLMVFWGGLFEEGGLGGRYDPVSDTWTPVATARVPIGSDTTAVWTGNDMLLWGGFGSLTSDPPTPGSRYDPVLDSWTPMQTDGQPLERAEHSAVWTGREMIVWGGSGHAYGAYYLKSGGRYDPLHDRWKGVRRRGAPNARWLHTAIWTGSKMVVWGGLVHHHQRGNRGGIYDPVTNTWTATTLDGAPESRYRHTMTWTGSRVIVWGGYGDDYLSTGAAFDPVANQWSPTSLVDAPEGRTAYTALWTGTHMIVWGGRGEPDELSTGASYDPDSDRWEALSLANAPAARAGHTAIWTGDEMVVWGGGADTDLDSGALYDPSTDTWVATSLDGAPCPRSGHTAVWTGVEMIVWGGLDAPTSGGRYVPSLPVEAAGGGSE